LLLSSENIMAQETALSTVSVLVLGLLVGLKHAMEADHLAAVSTIVSERKSLLSASLVGGLWGLGHTISLLLAGVAVLLLDIQIGERLSLALEFCVAVMLVALGVNAIRKVLSGGTVHFHQHRHGEHTHAHPHLHEAGPEPNGDTHHGLKLNARPVLVGMMHGLAGSGALMLLIVPTISTPLVGFIFIIVFGIGSIGGMLVMSALISLPVHFTANRFAAANRAVRMLAGVFSLGFGLFMAYEIGFARHLFG
jgi:ABC-type nickel/cobalt efflux system permease component RcnA